MTILLGTNGTETLVRETGAMQIPRLPPDFLSDLVASVNFMRLSLLKAAYVAVDESSVVGNPECARDDKLEDSGPPWHLWRGMDRVNQPRSPPTCVVL
jgi:hypothetical protein